MSINSYGTETIRDLIKHKIRENSNVEKLIGDIKFVKASNVPKEVCEADTGECTDSIDDRSSQGFYYERLWDICVKFGVTDLTLTEPGRTSHVFDDNPNKDDVVFNKKCWAGGKLKEYLKFNVRSGSSGGYSDITFINKKNKDGDGEDLYLISSKYFKVEKDIAKYDIGKLCALVKKHENLGRKINVVLFVKNRDSAIKKFNKQHASSDILLKYINPGGKFENVYDLSDLQKAYFKLRKLLEHYHFFEDDADVDGFEKIYLKTVKSIFIPRFHQKLFMNKIADLRAKGENKMMVGAIPRSGKSYIMAGVILDSIQKRDKKNLKFLIMTPAPNETFGEYEKIFNDYVEFNDIHIDIRRGAKGKQTETQKKKCEAQDCVTVISKQMLGWTEPTDRKLGGEEDIDKIVKRVKEVIRDDKGKFDVIFLDEAHFGMSTTNAKRILAELDSASSAVKIYVTATYNKPMSAYGIDEASKLTWGIGDVDIMKNITLKNVENNDIEKRFGKKIYNESLAYFGDKTDAKLISSISGTYANYPKPHLITSVWDKDFLNAEKLKIGDTEFGWDMNKLFATKDKGTEFINTEQITELMRYYFGTPDKEEDYDKQAFYRTRGILPRIKSICENKCRTLQGENKTSQLWFLPTGEGKIENKILALVKLLSENEFKYIKDKFHFFVAVEIKDKKGKTEKGVTYMKESKKIKTEIEKLEEKIKNGDDGISGDNLIILAGNRLQLGISLRNVDIVTLWNSSSSDDAIFQMLFRSMTETDHTPCGLDTYCSNKKFGFMVDMNPQRAVMTVNLFSENITPAKKKEGDEKNYTQITDLINIDGDVFADKYGDNPTDKDKEEFAKKLFGKLYSAWDTTVDNVKRVISKFSFDQTELKKIIHALKKINTVDKSGATVVVVDPEESFAPGAKRKKLHSKEKDDAKDKPKKIKEFDAAENAAEIIGEYISLLNIFAIYSDTNKDCVLNLREDSPKRDIISDVDSLKNKIFKDKEQKEMFLKILNGRLTGNSAVIYDEAIVDIAMGSINDTNKHTINKIVQSQQNKYYTIHYPGKLLEFINENLAPKEREKKLHGEVFTPIPLVTEMLDKLDESYQKEHSGKSIFEERDFKWFDPAVGIGNFPIIVYQKLMIGLLSQLPNEEERRKHILENMLYMSELTPKNVFICKKIFCGDKYKLNIFEGDTLKELNIHSEWPGVDKFDVVLGNPPYNEGGIRSHTGKLIGENAKTKTLWPLFVEKSFELLKPDGYLVFINPLSWLKKSHSMHTTMLEKHIVWLKLWDNIKSLETINGKIPISLYILHNRLNNAEKKTEIISDIKSKKLLTSSTVYLNPKYSFPLAFHSIFNKLIMFIENNDCNLEYNTKTVKSIGEKVKLPKIYTLEDMWAVDTYTILDGILVKKAIAHHKDEDNRKLIIANKSGFAGAFIDEGKLSLTGNHKFYILGENLEVIRKMLNFRISNVISHYLKYGQDFLDSASFLYIPDLRKLGYKDITEEEFYNLIKLTKEEINSFSKEKLTDTSNTPLLPPKTQSKKKGKKKKLTIVPKSSVKSPSPKFKILTKKKKLKLVQKSSDGSSSSKKQKPSELRSSSGMGRRHTTKQKKYNRYKTIKHKTR